MFGSQGVLPLAVFQTLMVDYDLTIIDSDAKELKEQKYLVLDTEKNELVNYLKLFKDLEPQKKAANVEDVTKFVVRIQAIVRGRRARRLTDDLRAGGMENLKDDIKNIAKDKGKKLDPKANAKQTKEERMAEMKKKKAKAAQDQRLNRRKQGEVENKLNSIVRPPRDAKEKERQRRAKEDLEKFIKEDLIESLISKAHCYGESLQICKDIQTKFEQRPVTKFVYPLLQQFQFSCTGVQPKSLQTMNSLGQLMFLNRQNQLSQYDISTTKVLQSVNLGTRPPLKHYDIIDMICD